MTRDERNGSEPLKEAIDRLGSDRVQQEQLVLEVDKRDR